MEFFSQLRHCNEDRQKEVMIAFQRMLTYDYEEEDDWVIDNDILEDHCLAVKILENMCDDWDIGNQENTDMSDHRVCVIEYET